MGKSTNKLGKSLFFAGSVAAMSMFGSGSADADNADLFNYNELGSGAQVRTELMHTTSSDALNLENKCGSKTEEAKCGEGKCGEGKEEKETEKEESKKEKSEENKEEKAEKEGKTEEAKCGEGKCGG